MSYREIYNKSYYDHYGTASGSINYGDRDFWGDLFQNIAKQIVENHHPKTFLDAGCAFGFLVAELRKLGVEAYGIDVSEYAISNVPEEAKGYCFAASLLDKFPEELPEKFDLITNIEVIEHLYAEDGDRVIEKLCSLTDAVLFSSDPTDYAEITHVNVQQPEYWVERFARHGFYHVLDYDASYYSPQGMFFQRAVYTERQIIYAYERNLRYWKEQNQNIRKKTGEKEWLATVLFDFGEGYQKNSRVYLLYTSDNPMIRVGLSIPEGAKKVKLELASYRALVTDFNMQPLVENTVCRFERSNGLKIASDAWLFNTTEGYLEYTWEGISPCVAKLDLNVLLLKNEDEYNIVREYVLNLEARTNQLCNQHTQQMQMIEDHLQQIIREKQEIREALSRVETEKQQETEQKNLLAMKVSNLEQEYHNAIHAYHTIANSRTWKMTKPVRMVLDFLKGNKCAQPAPAATVNTQEPAIPAMEQAAVRIEDVSAPKHADSLAPFMPESVIHNRMPAEKMAAELAKYDVISFDIFDTLIFRVFDKPTDVFRMMAHEMRLEGFYPMRLQAERDARKHAPEKQGEVTIYEIYQELYKTLNLDIEAGIAHEMDAEKRACIANPYMQTVYNMLRKQDKKIVFTSDMYLTKDLLFELLTSCGYELDKDTIYVSCEHGCNKGSGELQKIAAKNSCKKGEIFIHVGDNLVTDVERTRKAGFEAFYYESCRDIGQKFRPEKFERLSNSLYNAVVNQHLHQDDTVYSPEYEHGFKFAGYLTCGFCEWLNQYAKEKDIDKFLFLARDTDIIQKVYNQFYKKIDNEYVVVSRMALRILSFEKHPAEYIQYFLKTRAEQEHSTIGTALAESNLECLMPYLNEYNLNSDMILDMGTYEALYELGYEKRGIIAKAFSASKKAGYDYIRSMVGDAKRICMVDLGWNGQIIILLREIIDDCTEGRVKAYGAYVAAAESETANMLIEAGILDSYLWSYAKNRNLILKTDTWAGNMLAKTIEATFTSSAPTLLKYELAENGDCNLVYGIETSDRIQIDQIQKGIFAFSALYNAMADRIGLTKKIDAPDAFKPYSAINNDFLYAYRIFKNNLEKEISLPSVKGKEVYTTLGEIMKKWNLI